MRFQRCVSTACRRPFQVNEFAIDAAGSNGRITCPHCGHAESVSSANIFLSHAMSPEEEAKFENDNPKG
jgi:hypothetical protein